MATVALAGGGTGGHVYPALAIGDELVRRGHTLVYYGDADRLEGRVAPQRNIPFRAVRAQQFPRAGLLGKVSFAWSLLRATLATASQLRADRVDLVLGVGGYISAPTVLAAWLLRIPRVIHESNVTPGLANRLCARVADRVLLTYEGTGKSLPGTAPRQVVGMPVPARIAAGDRGEGAARYGMDPARPILLFVGGSLGAARLNELALAVSKGERAFQVVHLCGPRYEAEVRAALGEPPADYRLVPYEDRMDLAYAAADLVVCRAGSSTLAELALAGKASLLIPSPNVTDNHQEGNARALEAAGAAAVVVEKGWDLASAVAEVRRLMGDAERLRAMSAAARGLAHPAAASVAADAVTALL